MWGPAPGWRGRWERAKVRRGEELELRCALLLSILNTSRMLASVVAYLVETFIRG